MKIIKITKKKTAVILEFEEDLRLAADPVYVSKNKIQIGSDIGLEDFVKDNEQYLYQTALDAAFNYLSYAPRTEKQIYDHLTKKYIEQSIIKKVIEKLKEYKYADDESYAANYVSYGSAAKKGKQYLKRKLKQKGVSEKHIEKSLESYDEATEMENARSFIDKQNTLLKKYPPLIRKEKIIRKAAAQGFSFELLSELIREIISDEDDETYEDYFAKRIDKKCALYIKKGLEAKEIRTKLYAEFLPQGAKKGIIDERMQ